MSRRAFYCWRQKGLLNASELDLFPRKGHLALLSGGAYSCCRTLQGRPRRCSQPVCDNQLHRRAGLLTETGHCRIRPPLLGTGSDCLGFQEVLLVKSVSGPAPLERAYGLRAILPSTPTGWE